MHLQNLMVVLDFPNFALMRKVCESGEGIMISKLKVETSDLMACTVVGQDRYGRYNRVQRTDGVDIWMPNYSSTMMRNRVYDLERAGLLRRENVGRNVIVTPTQLGLTFYALVNGIFHMADDFVENENNLDERR